MLNNTNPFMQRSKATEMAQTIKNIIHNIEGGYTWQVVAYQTQDGTPEILIVVENPDDTPENGGPSNHVIVVKGVLD